MSIITFIPSLKIKADVKQINPYSIPENPSLNLHFVWLVGLEDLKWDVKSLKLPSLGLSSYDDKWLKTLSIQTNHVHSIFLLSSVIWKQSLKELNRFLTLILILIFLSLSLPSSKCFHRTKSGVYNLKGCCY